MIFCVPACSLSPMRFIRVPSFRYPKRERILALLPPHYTTHYITMHLIGIDGI